MYKSIEEQIKEKEIEKLEIEKKKNGRFESYFRVTAR